MQKSVLSTSKNEANAAAGSDMVRTKFRQASDERSLRTSQSEMVQCDGMACWDLQRAQLPNQQEGFGLLKPALKTSITVDSCQLVDRQWRRQDWSWQDSNFLLRVKARARKVRGGQSEIGRGSFSSTIVSVSHRCQKRHHREKRCSVKYVQDLLSFAVNTGRLTDACARVLSGLLLELNSDANDGLRALMASENEEPSTAPNTPQDPYWELDDPDNAASYDPLMRPIAATTSVIFPSPSTDTDAVLREVRFRKQYLGVRGFAGRTPLDPPPVVVDPRRACEPRRELAALSLMDARVGTRDINRAGTLEDLLVRYEHLIGTPAANVQSNVHRRAVAVRQLSKALCVHEAVYATPRVAFDVAETDPRLSRARRRESTELYRRLARALDQRVPPEQRLFREDTVHHEENVNAVSSEASLPIWVRAGRLAPAGSRIFGTETRLSDFQPPTD